VTALRLACVAACVVALPLAAQSAKELAEQVERLGAEDAAARTQAYQALARTKDSAVVRLLDKRIDDLPPAGQTLALNLLTQHPADVTRSVYARLADVASPLLCAAGNAWLLRANERGSPAALAKALAAVPVEQRQQALNGSWAIRDEAVFAALRGYLLPDANSALVVATLAHLQREELGRSPATTQVVRGLQTAANADVRAAALLWLVHGPDGDTHAAALASLLREDARRFWTIERLLDSKQKHPAVLTDAFVAALSAPRASHDVKRLAELVRAQAPERLPPTLRLLLPHQDAEIRYAAMQALADAPGSLEVADLQQMLRAGNTEQQVLAADVLRRRDDVSGLPVLLGVLQQPPRTLAAVRALTHFRSREVIEPLLLALDDGNLQVRATAWHGLQDVLRDLFPYRRFAFERSGYEPNQADRTAGIQVLRTWWQAVR
jgi:hypothetical protein